MVKIKIITVFCVLLITSLLANVKYNRDHQPQPILTSNSISGPPCIQLFDAIEKYAKKYNIPLQYAYNVAYCETRYHGPMHWDYDPHKTSCAGAVGPMQIIPSTAGFINKEKNVSSEKLKNNLDYNVETSMKYIRYLKDRYHSWDIVFGYYNTGRPIVNDYARNVINRELNF